MITAIILTKNEEKNIIDCLESVLFCDEVIVVDDYSTDRTVPLLERLKNNKIKIFQRHLANNFAAQRNFGLQNAKGDWVLFVDADERVPKVLAAEISYVIYQTANQNNGYYIKRKDTMWNRQLQYGEAGNMKLLRLAKKNTGQWKGTVHEVWDIKGSIATLQHALQHYPHPTLKEFLTEINYYSTVRANELYEKKVTTNKFLIILYPKAKFFQNYIIKQGFRDGTVGFIYAMLMSLHSFLVRGKLWLLWQKGK